MKSDLKKISPEGGLFTPALHENPYPAYQELRDQDPVYWDEPTQAWVITRFDDVALALKDPRFSSNRTGSASGQITQEPYRFMLDIMADKMSEKDEPDHMRLRSLVNKAFGRVALQRWQPIIRERALGLLDPFRVTGRCEFVEEYAIPLPMMTILQVVGIPTDDKKKVKSWCDDFANIALNYFLPLPETQLESARDSIDAFREYLVEQVNQLESNPQDNLLNALLLAEHEGSKLSMDELLANAFVLLTAGNETTTCLLANGVATLIEYPEQLQRLRDQPELIPKAIEELMRFDSPVQYLSRIAIEDVPMESKVIRKGDLVLAVIASANRDESRFNDPNQFIIERTDHQHMAFGHGRHYCPGSQLSRMEAVTTFELILEHWADFKLSGIDFKDLSHRENFNIRCLKKLPLEIKFRTH